MKVILIGDEHFGKNTDRLFYSYQEKTYQWIKDVIEKHQPDIIVRLGDTFDKHSSVTPLAIDRFYELSLKPFLHIPNYFILGNHDLFYKNTLKTSIVKSILEGFSSNNKIHVIDRPTETEFGLLLPWLNDESMNDSINALVNSTNDYCFGHLEFAGFKMTKTYTCDHEKLSQTYFKNFKKVFSGHFHISSEKGNIIYVGTPSQFDWNDVDDQKKLHLLNTTTHEILEIENPYSFFVTYKGEKQLDYYQNKFVKVDLGIYKPKVVEALAEMCQVTTFENVVRVSNDNIEITDTSDILQLWNEYIDTVDDYDEEMKNKLKSKFNEMYVEVIK